LVRLPTGFLRLTVVFSTQFIPAAIVASAYGFASYVALARYNYVIPMFYGIFCILFTFLMLAVYNFVSEEQNKRWYEQTWGRYMSPKMIQQLRSNPEQLNLGGEEREITLLFSDIRGFTPLSENLSPRQVVQLLNEYFEAMSNIVHENGGMLDKYIGDALMVHFGSPHRAPDDALRAVRAGLAMQRKVAELTREWEDQGRAPFQIRIGINTGTVIAGNIGSTSRQEYTAIGDDVNIAQRLEANCPPGGVLISRSTYEQVRDQVEAKPLEPLHVKGRREPVQVYLVGGLR
jgi:class 3 adenylate cyclase